MKYLLKLTLIGFLLTPLLTSEAWSQDQDNNKVKVKIITEENGKKKVFEKTYESKEAMRNDQEFQELTESEDLDIDEQRMAFVTEMESDDNGSTKDISIEIESDGSGQKIKVKKITKDEDGEEQVMGKTYDSWEELKADEEMGLTLKELEGDENEFEWNSDDKSNARIIIKKGKDMKEDHQEVEVIIEEEDGKVKKKIKKRIEIKIEEDDQ